jgi:hypothetical protein
MRRRCRGATAPSDHSYADRRVEAVGTQSPAPWGLDRIDQRNLPPSNTYNYNQTGAYVHA